MKSIYYKYLSPEWFDYRQQRITGTDVPGILGLSKHKTALSVWMEKTGKSTDEREATDLMNWGRHMEAACRSWTEADAGVKIHPNTCILQHDELPWLCCTPDGTIVRELNEEGTWEGKCPSPWMKAEWTESMPKAYQVQVLTSLAITKYPRGLLSALFQPELRWAWVHYDKALIEEILERCKDFWEKHVLMDVPPQAQERDADHLKALHPEDSGEVVTLDSFELQSASSRALRLMADQKRLDTELKKLKNQIRQAMGAASYAVLPDGTAWSYLRNARGTRVLTHIQRVPRNA